MAYEEIIFSTEDGVATITLNRPEVMNALTMTTYNEMLDALRRVDSDPDIRVLVFTGAGRAFCSGEDVRQYMGAANAEEIRKQIREIHLKARNYRVGPISLVPPALMAIDKPVIAAVNGAAVGWGCDLALMCDIRVASEKAKFGELFVLRGLIPDLGGLYFLPMLVGLEKAYELLFTGDIVDAQEALRIGLVSRVVPHDDLLPVTLTLAKRIASGPPLAIQMSKAGVRRALQLNLPALMEYHAAALEILFETEDHREGAAAFLEKRAPVYRGR